MALMYVVITNSLLKQLLQILWQFIEILSYLKYLEFVWDTVVQQEYSWPSFLTMIYETMNSLTNGI